jgi:hypothetical protein
VEMARLAWSAGGPRARFEGAPRVRNDVTERTADAVDWEAVMRGTQGEYALGFLVGGLTGAVLVAAGASVYLAVVLVVILAALSLLLEKL